MRSLLRRRSLRTECILGASTLRLVERARSCLVDRNVRLFVDFFFSKELIDLERIAIARALLRNPTVLLLDEVRLKRCFCARLLTM